MVLLENYKKQQNETIKEFDIRLKKTLFYKLKKGDTFIRCYGDKQVNYKITKINKDSFEYGFDEPRVKYSTGILTFYGLLNNIKLNKILLSGGIIW